MRRVIRGVLLGTMLWTVAGTAVVWAHAPERLPVVAPARVQVLNIHGRVIHVVRAKGSVELAIRFVLPDSFPSGYTDVRFEIVVNGRGVRSIIYGTPKHVHPKDVVHVALLTAISRTWVGKVLVRGTIRILGKPGGSPLAYQGEGSARLTVTR